MSHLTTTDLITYRELNNHEKEQLAMNFATALAYKNNLWLTKDDNPAYLSDKTLRSFTLATRTTIIDAVVNTLMTRHEKDHTTSPLRQFYDFLHRHTHDLAYFLDHIQVIFTTDTSARHARQCAEPHPFRQLRENIMQNQSQYTTEQILTVLRLEYAASLYRFIPNNLEIHLITTADKEEVHVYTNSNTPESTEYHLCPQCASTYLRAYPYLQSDYNNTLNALNTLKSLRNTPQQLYQYLSDNDYDNVIDFKDSHRIVYTNSHNSCIHCTAPASAKIIDLTYEPETVQHQRYFPF